VLPGGRDLENNPFRGKKAEKYDTFFSTEYGRKVFKLEKEILLELLNPFKNSLILEVGCGTGIWIKALKGERFHEPVGLDISADMLRIARKKGLKKLVRGTALNLPFRDNSFDLTLFITSLEFIPDRVKAFTEALRVTKKGIVVAFLNRYSLLNLVRSLKSALSDSVYSYTRFLTIGELQRIALSASRITGKKAVLSSFKTTLNFTSGSFVSYKLEKRLGFNSPFGAFGAALFRVEG